MNRPGNATEHTAEGAKQLDGDDSLLDEIDGPIRAEHLPRAVDRLEIALIRMLEAMPEFEGGGPIASQLGDEMACLRNAAREACCRAGVAWTSKVEQERWKRWMRKGID